MVYQKGGLGEFWASKYYNEYYGHIPNPIMKTHNVIRNDPVHKDYIDVFLYTKQLYTPYAYWLWDIEVVEPLLKHMNIDWCNQEIAKQIKFANKKSQLFTGWPDLPKELNNIPKDVPKNWLHSHIPPFLTSTIYNLTFKKTIFIKPHKNRDSILNFRISAFRGQVNVNEFYNDRDIHIKEYLRTKLNLNDDSFVENTIEFSKWWQEAERIIKDRSDKVETIYFDDLLKYDHDHVKNVKKMIEHIKHYIGE